MPVTSDGFAVLLVPGEKSLFFFNDRFSTSEKTTLNFADNTEVFQSEYSQHAILGSANFRRVVNEYCTHLIKDQILLYPMM